MLVVTVALGAAVPLAPPAEAANPHKSCSTRVARIYWDNDWPGDLLPVAKAGANYWERDRNWQGTGPAIDVSVGTFWNQTVAGDYDWMPSSSTWGWGLCTDKKFRINSRRAESWRNSHALLRSAVAHELGHVIGSDHVGTQDSFDGKVPLMATCRSSTTFSQDDGVLASAHSNRTGSYFNMTANSSFENGSRYWGRSNTSWATVSGGVDGSSRALKLTPSSTTSYIFSTTRINNPWSTIDWIKARGNYKLVDSSASGSVQVVLRVGKTNYPHGDTCGTPDVKGWDGVSVKVNDGTRSTNFALYYSKTCTVGGSWGYCTTSGTNPDNYDAANARVYLYNRVRRKTDNQPAPVLVDRTRIMVDF